MGELGEEMDADAGVCVGKIVVGLEDNIEGGGGIRGIPRGVPDNDDLCGGRSSSFSGDRLADIRRCSAGKDSTSRQPITLSEHSSMAPQTTRAKNTACSLVPVEEPIRGLDLLI